ncbi:MAG: hypothetical protein JWN41_56 [Thermoleophilia bacterium]|nr:hypothetical protein [Thermoleophilia bacterium]
MIDVDDDDALARFVAFERAHGGTHTVASRRSMTNWSLDCALLTVERRGELVAVCIASRQVVDGGRNVYLMPSVSPPFADAVAALVNAIAAWEPATHVPLLVANLRDPPLELTQALTSLGFEPHGARQRWSRAVPDEPEFDPPEVDGVQFVMLSERPHLERSVHAAWCEAYAAIPDDFVNGGAPSFDAWRLEVANAGEPLPIHVAVDQSDRVLGLACFSPPTDPDGVASHRMTGVIADARGRGIATALKITQLNWAAGRYRSIVCSNHEANTAMLRINERLAYERGPRIEMLARPV